MRFKSDFFGHKIISKSYTRFCESLQNQFGDLSMISCDYQRILATEKKRTNAKNKTVNVCQSSSNDEF